MSESPGHRRWHVLRGEHRETANRARRALQPLSRSDVLWIADDGGDESVSLSDVRQYLGESFDAVVLSLHRAFDPDALGCVHGLVRGGGRLLLRLPPRGQLPEDVGGRLAAHPHDPDDAEARLWERAESELFETATPDPGPIQPPTYSPSSTPDQDRLVDELLDAWSSSTPSRVTVTADRGRGKSSGIGRAIARRRASGEPLDVAVTARRPGAAAEIFEFALDVDEPPREGPVRFVPVPRLLGTDAPEPSDDVDVLVVDEAAQLSVPVLRRLARRLPDADLVFSTTTHGYEGTGRGFDLRFADWLRANTRDVRAIELEEPIRWAPDDPLEEAVFETLLLDADLADVEPEEPETSVEHRCFDRDALVDDERLLRDTFGLLVEAHYRTTPGDLHRMLDAPNIDVHGLVAGGRVVAATWVAHEGDFPADLAERIYWGHRPRGHAIPELLLSTLSCRDAGALEVIRSVRTAVHPAWRRRGLGTRLLQEVHRHYDPDLFGSLFGAQPAMIRLRRQIGHHLVHLSPSRGRRAGEPSVLMLRGASDAGRHLIRQLRDEFGTKLPALLDFIDRDFDVPLDDDLRDLLTVAPTEETDSERRRPRRQQTRHDPQSKHQPPRRQQTRRTSQPEREHPCSRSSTSLPSSRLEQIVSHYAHGPPTYEAAAHAVEPFVESHADALQELDPTHRTLLEARVRERRSWETTAERAELDTVRAAMRGLRRAVRALVDRAAPHLVPDRE